MKIKIVTIPDRLNIGNRLQNYAMQKILENYTEDVETINHAWNTRKLSFLQVVKRRVKYAIQHFLGHIRMKDAKYQKMLKVKSFNNKHIKSTKFIYNEKQLKKLEEETDFVVTGSDQVWNPEIMFLPGFVMLDFVSPEKKVAVAPSIALDSLTKEQSEMFSKYLSDFDNLSCREEQGAKLLEDVLGKQVVSLVDPTLMLSKDDWNKVAKKPKCHDENKKYVLLYFLGEMTDEYRRTIHYIKEKYGLEVINILDKSTPYYVIGPGEFVYLMKHASVVLTDSFHGSVFSYIFDRPFKIFKRKGFGGSMNTRLVNLMNKLNLNEDVYLSENTNLDNILDVSYDKSYLENEQKKFKNYLDNIFLK